MSRARLTLAVIVIAACTPPAQTGSALRVSIELQAGVRSTCVALSIKGADGAELAKSKGARTQGRMLVLAAIFRDAFPETVGLQAIGYSDLECVNETSPAERSELVEATFPERGPRDVALVVKRDLSGIDVDNDKSPAGVDCDDLDPQRRPGILEDCTDGKENNCDDYTDCGDPQCGGKKCKLNGSVCLPTGRCGELSCADGLDNDVDGQTDCADDDCAGKACRNGGVCANGTCTNASSEAGLCADGLDNDNDTKTDCEDPDCENQGCTDRLACTLGETCQQGQCRGGQAVVCGPPTTFCVGSPGVCSEALDGGCSYPSLPTDAGCDDGQRCTVDDFCDGDGGCQGNPVVCDAPPAGSCWDRSGFCDADAGCVYSLAVGQMMCTDNDLCTVNDVCLADGGCEGTPLDCANSPPPNECQVSTGACMNGNCGFSDRTGPCTGGTCVAGACVRFDGGLDGGAIDAGPIDGGPVDAGPGFLVPSNVPLSVIDAAPPYAHLNYTCSTILSLNPLAHVPVNFGCTPPPVPTVVTVPQSGGPGLTVIVVDRLTVASGVSVFIVPGTSATPADRAPVIAVRGDATVNGTLEVSAMFSPTLSSGPGAEGSWCPSPTLGTAQTNRSGGGQGGAFGEPGGPGGRGADNGGTGAPVLMASGNDTLVPLRGGCPGSRGGNSANGRYGRAGGALQLWARGTLFVGGSVLASGGRGLNAATTTSAAGGGGGGSGGALLLEATNLTLSNSAIIAANGGSGAQGSSLLSGADGRPGAAATTQVNGGSGANLCGGAGGKGSARDGVATGGSAGTCNNFGGGGGGGGSVGRVRFNALNPCTIGGSAKVSPPSSSVQASCRF